MNEQITLLALKASDPKTGWLDRQKFAELIVRECARALDDKLANPNGASMAWCDGSDLLEHFGVEE